MEPEEPVGGKHRRRGADLEEDVPTEEQEVEWADERGERSVRRMLRVLLGILSVAAIGLLVLLLWLLRPEPTPAAPAAAPSYPIRIVTSIYGYGTKPDQLLSRPLGVGFDRTGNVWISDTGHSRVLVFTAKGAYVRTIGASAGPGKLYTPYGIAADPARDRVYVADWSSRHVQIYSSGGSFIESFPAPDQNPKVFGPNGFSPYDVHMAGGRVVASSNDGLYFFDSTGHVVGRWGGKARGVDVGMFNFPDAFAVDSARGRIYVADTLNRRIVALDLQGRWLWVSGRPDTAGKITGFWQLPRGIEVGPNGDVYVVDTFRFTDDGVGVGHIVVLSPQGALVSEFGRSGDAESSLDFPEKIAREPGGVFALADREHNRVLLFRLGPIPPAKPIELSTYAKSILHPAGVTATPTPG